MSSDSLIHAAAGSVGGSFAMILTYPLGFCSTDATLSTEEEKRTTRQVILDTIKERGFRGLYVGLSPSLVAISITNFIYYYFYEGGRAVILKSRRGSKGLSTLESLLNGWIAGSITVMVSNPVWVIQNRQTDQSRKRAAPSSDTPPEGSTNLSIFRTMQLIVRKEGISSLWAGVGPALTLVINPILQYSLFEQLKNLVIFYRNTRLRAVGSPRAATLSDLDYFLLGAFSKLIATSITYPYIVVKNQMQAGVAKYSSAMEGLRSIIKTEGIAGLYKGINSKLLQSVLTAAILFASQRRMYEITKKALVTAQIVKP